jgi:hypothetical protein
MYYVYILITDVILMLLRDLRSHGKIFMNVCVVINVAMVMLLSDFRPYVFYLLSWLAR